MLVKIRHITLVSAGLAVLFVVVLAVVACNSPFGFGQAIDWEPPSLELDPGPNPRYVRLDTKLTGTITDNIAVGRVVLRAAAKNEKLNMEIGDEMFTAVLSGDSSTVKTWEISLDFSEEFNGERIAVEIVGFDMANNSGDSSIKAITLIIDIRPPFITDIYIERTPMRTALLEPLNDLKELEERPVTAANPNGLGTDPRGERSANANRYQNGWFRVRARLSESETRIRMDSVKLNIYDVDRDPDAVTPLLSLNMGMGEGTSTFSPVWLLKEEEIIAAGMAKGWSDYQDLYYNSGRRFYYLVAVTALDNSDNELYDYLDHFCLWYNSDFPKGTLDSVVAGTGAEVIVTRGATLPVEFFDDDQLEWAYTDMLTRDQWDGIADLNGSGLRLPQGWPDEQKLVWLMDELVKGTDIRNWKQDKHAGTTHFDPQRIEDLIGGRALNERIQYVETGALDSDYGFFVLVTFAGDSKLQPHDISTPDKANALRKRRGRVWYVQVIDENAPLIVFDTVDINSDDYVPENHPGNDPGITGAGTGNSPEENTFPRLEDGQFFEINGYTLRENGNGNNKVTKFRMAWIPFRMAGGPDSVIRQVQDALKSDKYPNVGFPNGVQHWEL